MEDIKYSFPVKFSKNEEPEVLEFANAQENWNDCVRYLVQKEVAENGVRNLVNYIPSIRNPSYFKEAISSSNRKIDDDKKLKEVDRKEEVNVLEEVAVSHEEDIETETNQEKTEMEAENREVKQNEIVTEQAPSDETIVDDGKLKESEGEEDNTFNEGDRENTGKTTINIPSCYL